MECNNLGLKNNLMRFKIGDIEFEGIPNLLSERSQSWTWGSGDVEHRIKGKFVRVADGVIFKELYVYEEEFEIVRFESPVNELIFRIKHGM